VSGAGAVVVVVAVLTVTGFGVIAVLRIATTRRELVRHAALAPLAGMAWAGIVAGTAATLGSRLGILGLAALAVVTCVAGGARIARSSPRTASRVALRRNPFEIAAGIVSLLAIGVVLVAALEVFRIKPLAEYDGWAMWGMKARAIALLGGTRDVFASDAYERLHLEYPLLLPALHALPLQLADGFSSNTVVLSCLVVGLAGLLALWGVLRDRVRPVLLVPFLAAIATAPAFFGQLATGYADVPLAVFVAAGSVALARWLVDHDVAWLALGTLFLAAAVLTKNEGLLFAFAAFGALLATADERRRAVLIAGAVLLSAYTPWRAYVAIHDLGAPDYDLSSSLNLPWVVGRLDRAPEAAEGLLRAAGDEFGVLIVVGFVCSLVAWAAGLRSLAAFAMGYTALSYAGLVWIYVLTPNDVSNYLSTNGDRVVVSLVIGSAALCPLLVEESVQALTRTEGDHRHPPLASGR
jgi:hypothetical protein